MNTIETGRIVNTHGIRGEMKIVPWADSPEVFRKFKHLTVGGVRYAVASVRVQGQNVLVKLNGINDINAAEVLKNQTVYADRDDFALPEGTYFISDLIGLRVIEEGSGKEIGIINDVLQTGANDVYELSDKSGAKKYLPAIRDCILHTDLTERTMTVRIPEGLFDE